MSKTSTYQLWFLNQANGMPRAYAYEMILLILTNVPIGFHIMQYYQPQHNRASVTKLDRTKSHRTKSH